MNQRYNKNSGGGKYPRQSNFELLRIVAMSMILIVHIFTHVIKNSLFTPFIYVIYPIFCCGVPLFFMISGWFGIRLTLKSLTRLVGLVFLFTMTNYMLCYITNIPFTVKDMVKYTVFPITFTPYWFIKVYFLLMLTAPIINRGLNQLNVEQLRYFIIILSVFVFYSSNLGKGYNDPNGYRYSTAFYLYCIGYYLRMDDLLYRKISQLILIILSILTLLFAGFTHFINAGLWSRFTCYNSMPLVFSSVCLLVFFSRLKIQNNIINKISAASFGCYLLQDGKWGFGFFYNYLHDIYVENTVMLSLIVFLIVFFAIWITSLILTPAFNYLSRQAFLVLNKIKPLKNAIDILS